MTTRIRVERVQDISEADAWAEGIWNPSDENPGKTHYEGEKRDRYAALWDSINAKRGFGWKANPWVWAIKYTVLKRAPEGWKEYCDAR